MRLGPPPAQREDARGREHVEDPRGEDHVSEELLEAPGRREQDRPARAHDHRKRGRSEARVHFGELAEEHAVARHRVVHARVREREAVRRAEHRDQHRHRDQLAGLGPEQRAHGFGRHAVRPRHGRGAEGGEVGDVGEQVDPDGQGGADGDAAREDALGIEGLARRARHVRPPLVGPQHADHRHAHAGEDGHAGRRGERDGPGAGESAAPAEEQAAHHENRPDLDPRAPVLNVGAVARATHIDRRHNRDHQPGDDLACHGAEREELPEVLRERHRQSGDRPGGDHEEEGPTKQERR